MLKVKKFTPIILFGLTAFVLTCEKIPDYCGKGEWYDPGVQFCFGSKPYPKCGGKDFNPLVEGCINGIEIGAKCSDGRPPVPLGTPCGGYALSTAAIPENGGKVTRTPNAPNYPAREDVAVIAQPADGYSFVGWAGTGTHATATPTIKMDAAKTMVAMFMPSNAPGTLTTAAFPENGGAVARNPDAAVYKLGTAVTVTATPKQGYTFDGWAGSSASKDPEITLAMDDSKTLVAMFAPNARTLKINAIPADGGAVYVDGTAFSASMPQNFGKEIEILAAPAEGYRFAEWAGDAQGSEIRTRITVKDGDMEITAKFAQGNARTARQIYPVTIEIGAGGAKVTGGSYAAGETVSINAGAATGQTFRNWTSATGGVNFANANSRITTFTMIRGAVTVTANFGAIVVAVPGSFSDSRDGKSYKTTKIGTQTWMAENLNYNASGSYCYDNNNSNCDTYGRLYDWETAKTACPIGWWLPSNGEWETLREAAGGWSESGKKLKTTSGWFYLDEYSLGPVTDQPYGNGTDDYGFSGMPGGWNAGLGRDDFVAMGGNGVWWSSSDSSGIADVYDGGYHVISWILKSATDYLSQSLHTTGDVGLSVRCVQSGGATPPTPSTYAVTVTSAGTGAAGSGTYAAGATVSISAGTPPSGQEFQYWTSSSNGVTFANETRAATTFIMPSNSVAVTAVFAEIPPTDSTHTHDWGDWVVTIPATCDAAGVETRTCGSDASHKETRAIAMLTGAACQSGGGGAPNNCGVDGTAQSCKTVTLTNGQTWMAENLNYETGESWCYDDDPSMCQKYGRLYTWEAAMTACPSGWHLPSSGEWSSLVDFAGGDSLAGKALKATNDWGQGDGGTDNFGFSALPGGAHLNDNNGTFGYGEYQGYWWTATDVSWTAYYRNMGRNYDGVEESFDAKDYGYSVRCIANDQGIR